MPLLTARQRVAHLLRRTGFGQSAAELNRYVTLGVDGTIDELLTPERVDDTATDAAVSDVLTPFSSGTNDDDTRRAQRAALFEGWYMRLLMTRRPLLERMTYFWHNHFATGISKVNEPALMQQQNDTLRARALGSFEALLQAMARDPAMLVWLDNRSNTRQAPNENYARELLELHTLGEGNGYTEQDIKEAARALTGWRVTPEGARFQPALHDSGEKTFLGERGRFTDADIVRILARHPGTATHLADRMVRFFVSPDPPTSLVQRTAQTYLTTNGDLRAMVRTILRSDEMYADTAYRTQIKSPVDVVIGVRRTLGAESGGQFDVQTTRQLGQLLYDPPNPAGWSGGTRWINASTMLGRANFVSAVTRLRGPRTADIPALLRAAHATQSATQVVDWVLDLLVGGDVDTATRSILIDHIGGTAHFDFDQAARDGSLNGMVYLALSMPVFQVA